MEGKRRLRKQPKGAFRTWVVTAACFAFVGVTIGCVPGGTAPTATAFHLENDNIVDQPARLLNGDLVKSRRRGLARAVIGLQMFRDDGAYISSCTGVLIRPDVVLTAAHCFDSRLLPGVKSVRAVQTADLTSTDINDPHTRRVIHTSQHPLYNSLSKMENGVWTPTYDHDLALVFVDRSFESDGSLVRLARDQEGLTPGAQLVSYGYGFDHELVPHVYGGPRNYKLKRAIFTVSARWRLDRVFMELDPKYSVCQGDSGGPSFLKTDDNAIILVAINSASNGKVMPGDGNRQYCRGEAVMKPVAPERSWIEQKLKETGR